MSHERRNSSSENDISLKMTFIKITKIIGGPIRNELTSVDQLLVWGSLVRNIDQSKSNPDDIQVDLEIQYRQSLPKLGVKSKEDGQGSKWTVHGPKWTVH